MKVGVYNRHILTLGGGEKFSLSLAEVLSKNHQVDYISYQFPPKDIIEKRLNVDLKKVKLRSIPDISDDYTADKITRDYDLFINASYMTSLPSRAPKSILIVYFPTPMTKDLNSIQKLLIRVGSPILKRVNKSLLGLNLPSRVTNLPRNLDFLNMYDLIVGDSMYAQKWIKGLWGRESELLYPPVDLGEAPATGFKTNIILSVGRFFPEEHSKGHLDLVQVFKTLYDEGLRGWEYHLVGGLGREAKDRHYFSQVKEAIAGYSATIHSNISSSELDNLYRMSKIFWHATGYGQDEEKDPETFEHFGIATVEAMSRCCVPIVYRGGGSVEIIGHGKNGFLWSSLSELKEITLDLVREEALLERLGQSARQRSEFFSMANFAGRVNELVAKL